jgi:hypothetical protein
MYERRMVGRFEGRILDMEEPAIEIEKSNLEPVSVPIREHVRMGL